MDGDRELLTYLPGEVAADPEWEPGRGARLPVYARTDAALTGAARLIRRLHDASRGFAPRATGFRFHAHAPGPGEIVSHGDLGPWNTVYADGEPVAFIDWDAAGPVEPLAELAAAAWAFVPLAPDARLREAGFDPVPDIAARLRWFADAYGLADRGALVAALWRWLAEVTPRLDRALRDEAGTAG